MDIFIIDPDTLVVEAIARKAKDAPFAKFQEKLMLHSVDGFTVLSGQQLVKLHNRVVKLTGGNPVKRFARLADAKRRTWAALEELSARADELGVHVLPSLSKAEARKAREENKLPPLWQQSGKWSVKPGPKSPEYDPKAKIRMLRKTNPHREGTASHKRFNRWKSGETVAQYLKRKDATGWDIFWGIKLNEIANVARLPE